MGRRGKQDEDIETIVKPPTQQGPAAPTVAPAKLPRPVAPEIAMAPPKRPAADSPDVAESKLAQQRRKRAENRQRRVDEFVKRALTYVAWGVGFFVAVRFYLYYYAAEIETSFRNFNEWFVR